MGSLASPPSRCRDRRAKTGLIVVLVVVVVVLVVVVVVVVPVVVLVGSPADRPVQRKGFGEGRETPTTLMISRRPRGRRKNNQGVVNDFPPAGRPAEKNPKFSRNPNSQILLLLQQQQQGGYPIRVP